MAEREILQAIRRQPLLRVDKLEFIALLHDERCIRLRTDADPIEARGRANCAIGFNGNHEAALMQRRDEMIINLQKRFAPCENDKAILDVIPPDLRNHSRQLFRVSEAASETAVCTDKIGIAERAYRVRAIAFPA